MIRNLAGAGQVRREVDVVIAGAGTIGLVVASRLVKRGHRVLVVESGDRHQEADTHPLNEVVQDGSGYAGAAHGRFRCLGGTSTRWGGALIPFQAQDLRDAEWPLGWPDIEPYLEELESLFGLEAGSYDEPAANLSPEHVGRLAKWPPFRKRNVYSLLREEVESATGPEVWLNATLTEFVSSDSNVTAVEARCEDGSALLVTAREVVLAAGAIESTRLLLLLERQTGRRLSKMLGLGLHDHLSAVVADIDVHDRRALNRLLSFRFGERGTMRSLRFELAPDSASRAKVLPCFGHVGFSSGGSGFEAVRTLYRKAQKRQLPSIRDVVNTLADIPWLLRALYWRYVRKRLLYPEDAELQLHIVVEQASRSENRIWLSEEAVDRFGNSLAGISWRVSEDDVRAMRSATDHFEESWRNSDIAALGTLVRKPIERIEHEMIEGGGIYHPGGTTRMGFTELDGVVDRDLRVFGLGNVSVCSTSVLPSGGGANPTMMAMLLALRCSDRLTAAFRASGVAVDAASRVCTPQQESYSHG